MHRPSLEKTKKQIFTIMRLLTEIHDRYFKNEKNIFYLACVENNFKTNIEQFNAFLKSYGSFFKGTFYNSLSVLNGDDMEASFTGISNLLIFLEKKVETDKVSSSEILSLTPEKYFAFSRAGLKFLLSLVKNNNSSYNKQFPEELITQFIKLDNPFLFDNLLLPEDHINNNNVVLGDPTSEKLESNVDLNFFSAIRKHPFIEENPNAVSKFSKLSEDAFLNNV